MTDSFSPGISITNCEKTMRVQGPKLGLLNAMCATRAQSRMRIVGGKIVIGDRYPWTTALFWKGSTPATGQFCGGSLVDPFYVVSAAHCVSGIGDLVELQVMVGSVSLELPAIGEIIDVSDILVHPGYDPDTLDNDIAILRLSTPSSKPTINLVPHGDPGGIVSVGTVSTAIGWGATSEGGEGSSILREVDVPVVDQQAAQTLYSQYGGLIDNMFAAGVPGRDTCQGDSGGPLIVSKDGTDTLVGITSWGIGCARNNLPGVYARLSNYRDWISATIS
jgi:trypsin